jgi:hypothetical protein
MAEFWKTLAQIALVVSILAGVSTILARSAQLQDWCARRWGKPKNREVGMGSDTGQKGASKGWRFVLSCVTAVSLMVFMVSGYFWLSESNTRIVDADKQITSLTNRMTMWETNMEHHNYLEKGGITTTVLTCAPISSTNGPFLVMFTLQMVNSGWPNSATDWALKTTVTGGHEIITLTGIPGHETYPGLTFGTNFFQTPFGAVSNMPPERNFFAMFQLNNATIPIGGILTGWIAFPVKGIDHLDTGTKFEISFRDAFGRTNIITHLFNPPFGSL